MKTAIAIDKAAWHPSVLPGQIVLISTVDERDQPNLAPKSWISMVAFEGPVLMFGCNLGHTTYRNAVATGCFVVNVPDSSLAARIWAMLDANGAERIARCGFTLVPALRVAAPLVEDCRAHLECETLDTRAFGQEALVFGTIVSASIDSACTQGTSAEQYAQLQPIFFLENRLYAPLGAVSSIG